MTLLSTETRSNVEKENLQHTENHLKSGSEEGKKESLNIWGKLTVSFVTVDKW